jgi:hypothetical protein
MVTIKSDISEIWGDALVPSSHEQQALILGNSTGKLLYGSIKLEYFFNHRWQGMKRVDNRVSSFSERDSVFRQLKGDHEKSNILGSVSLKRRIHETQKIQPTNKITLVDATPTSGPALM